MGPTNVALVKLFEADQTYRQAIARYDAASRDVRIQERKVKELQAKLDQTNAQLREQQAKSGAADVDIKSREAHIEKLREQQQTAKNNKEYQTFLIEINTQKVDKTKLEDALLKLMEAVEKLQAESNQLASQVQAESQKLDEMRLQINEKLSAIKVEIDQLKPLRDEAAKEIPAQILETFNKLCDRFEGEAMAPIEKPDRRVEEYACGACNMSMAVDIYNRLHTRNEPMFCPSCRRFLYIPDDLPPEDAIKQKKKPKKDKGEQDSAEASNSPAEAQA